MGHRFSKTAANNIATATTAGQEQAIGRRNHEELTQQEHQPPQTFNTTATTATTTSHIPIPIGNNSFVGPTINLQIQESPSTGNSGGGGVSATCLHNTTTAIASSSANISTSTGILQQSSSSSSSSSSLTSVNNLSCGRQIIIKIQLAKMENGNEISAHTTTNTTSSSLSAGTFKPDISLETLTADCNLNSSELVTAAGGSGRMEGAAQFFNITLNSSSSSGNGANDMTNATESTSRTAGSSASSSSASSLSNRMTTRNNNYLNPTSIPNTSSTNFHTSSSTADALRERLGRFNPLKFNDEMNEQTIGEIVEYCEVLEEQQQQPQSGPSVSIMPSGGSSSNAINATQTPAIVNEEPELEANVCCRRKSKSLAANGGASSSNASSTKRRCRKCSCRDAFRRILDPSSTKSSNKAQKQQQQQLERERQEQKSNRAQERHSIPNIIPTNHIVNPIQMQRNSIHSTTLATNSSPTSFVLPTVSPTAATAVTRTVWGTATTTTGGDVIIPLTAPPQFVVVQCAIVNPTPTPAATNTTIIAHQHHNTSPTMVTATSNAVGLLPNSIITLNENPTSSLASVISSSVVNNVPYPLKLSTSSESSSSSSPTTALSPAAGPIVHSQVDFVHYLVPDLERITSSSFYWGKMDRYEAERLLEGKPEGTFLLRDSAQEEFLFSVTFRKYGRSLHARIEQSGHRFSFDCHDPGVYTAPTVTALLEHYKDPACVMFFEPMLTIPLHRKNCFSLQQLCRATIVSNTTYDGINELELPARLKSYLKEYHYKQKLRVKSTEHTYTTHCK